MMRKSTVVKKLFEELSKIAKELEYDLPVVRENVIEWDGPFEWALSMTGGCSAISMELSDSYDPPMSFEKGFHKVLAMAQNDGYVVECMTAHSIGVY